MISALLLAAALGSPAAAAPGSPLFAKSGESLALDAFDLPPGATVTIELEVTIDNPVSPVCNQGEAESTDFGGNPVAVVLSDDPDTPAPNDPTCTLVLLEADLAILKGDSADPVDAGSGFSYTLSVTNNGPATATSLTVTDTLPAGVAFVAAAGTGWSCGESLGVVTCTRPSLAVGAAPAITIGVTAPAEGGTVNNTASVDAAENDPAAGNDSDSEMTTVTAVADLAITKSDSADPVDATTGFSYTLNVTNAGPSTATSIVVTDTLPAGVAFVSASGTGWSCGELTGVVTCTRPTLAVGAAPAITINVTAPDEGGVITNMVTVDAAENDPVAGNDSDSEGTTVTAVADLAIAKSDSADPVDAASAFSYTLDVTNNGPSTATSVSVTDTLPAGVAFVAAAGTGWSCGEAAGVVTCTRPTLAVGAAPAITIDVTAPDESGTINNAASVDAAESDPAAGNDSDTEQTAVTAVADLAIAKSDSADPVDAGSGFSYTLDVTNNGPSTATSLTVTDTLPAGVAFVAAAGTGWSCGESLGVVTCTRPTLAPGAAPAITVDVTAPAESGTVSNTASVDAAENDPAAGNDSDSEDTAVTAVADLAIAKSDSADPVDAVSAFSYTLDVTNNGPSTATSLTVTDTLPAGVAFVAASGTGWSCGEALGTVTCTRPALAVGAAPAITVDVTAPAEGGAIFNTAAVDAAEDDPAAGNDSDTEETTVTAVADLAIAKSDSADPVDAASGFSYTLAVTNNGPSTATSLTVTDTLPAGVAFVAAAGTGWSCGELAGVVTCTRPSLAVGAAPAITVDVTAPAEGGTINNTAAVSAAEGDPVAGNDSDGEATAVTAVADLAIVKSDSADPVDAASAFSYTLDVTNNGPSTATSLTVTDTLPAGVAFVAAAGTGWSCGELAGVVTCTRPTLAVGAAPAITVDVTAPAEGGTITNSASVSAAESDPTAGNDSDSEDTAVAAVSDLAIVKSDSADPVDAESAFSYTLDVTNNGPSTAAAVTVTDTLPAGMAFVSAAGTGWSCGEAAGVVTCTRPTLAVGAAPAITLAVTAPDEGGAINNTASVDAAGSDPTAGNDSDTEGTTVTAVADLAISKTAVPPAGALNPGQMVTYTITVTNDGPSTATGVIVTDALPAGLVSATTAGDCAEGAAALPTCTLGTIAPGASKSYTIDATVDSPAPPAITNTATVDGSEDDPDTDNNSDEVTHSTDVEPPTVIAVDTVPGDGALESCETVRTAVRRLKVTFSEAMRYNGVGPGPDDVNHPDNYLLLGTGPDLDFSTDFCGLPQGDDVAITIDMIYYAADTPAAPQSTATLHLGSALPDGLYRFMACGSTTLEDAAGNALDGDGNGSGGDDYVLHLFRVDARNLFDNGHFDFFDEDGVDCGGLPPWLEDPPAFVVHDPAVDAQGFPGSPLSGAAAVMPADSVTLDQCVSFAGYAPGTVFEMGGRFRLDASSTTSISLIIGCDFTSGAACGGAPAGSVADPEPDLISGDPGVWGSNPPFRFTLPPGAVSGMCGLGFENPLGSSFSAWLDQLFLQQPAEIFTDGFESGDTSAWSVTVP